MEKRLTTIEQKEVVFYEDELIAIRADDGHIYVSVRHLSDALGLNPTGQIRRIRRQSILDKACYKGFITTPGGRQPANWLRVDLVPLFVTGLNTNSVREDIRPKLERFQEEAAKVLWEAFQQGRLTSSLSFDELLNKDTPAVKAYKQALAILELARGQVLLEARLDDFGERLERIEAMLGDTGRYVTPDQANQISQAVKTVAMRLGKQSGRNEYGSVYGELYRKFAVTGYKQLPASKFQEAMNWLNEWRENIEGKLPF
jgi:hypothetical protein